jgi:hypothetical protein
MAITDPREGNRENCAMIPMDETNAMDIAKVGLVGDLSQRLE